MDRHRPCFSSRGVFFSGRRFLAYPLGWRRVFVPGICGEGGQRCSRRGRAAASLSAGLVHRLPRSYPPPSPAGAIVRRGRASLRPSGCLASVTVRSGATFPIITLKA